jgi:two-component system, cell cycle response regulator
VNDLRDARGGSVLVVEDSGVVRAVVCKGLTEHGYDVEEVKDGGEAMEAFRRTRPDVVLLDIEMPVFDGFQILDLIKEDPDLGDTPVVFLTAREGTDDLVRALQLGAHDYLRKPFEPAELIARVRAAVRVKTLQDELRLRNAELEVVSRTDALTGLWNRRHAEEQLLAAASAARRHASPLSVLMIDIDHFKRVNDECGHAAGDAVLAEIAARIRRTTRIEDVAARWGGEEFLTMLPLTEADGAWELGERIRTHVAAEPFTVGDDTIEVTASVGCATAEPGEGSDALVARADQALYEAKARGRNRTLRAKGSHAAATAGHEPRLRF